MANDIKVFEHDEFGQIRTVLINDQTWFVGKDVARALGYANGSRDINRHVEIEDKVLRKLPQYQNGSLVSNTVLINESGLYSLILSSKLPKAKKFKRWVTSDVLPSIRNTGAYIASNRLDELDDRVKKLESKTVIGKAQKPIVGVNTSEIAFSLGISPKALFEFLRSTGVANRKWDKYESHDDYVGFGYIQNARVAYERCYEKRIKFWTLKGVWFVMDLYNKRQANN